MAPVLGYSAVTTPWLVSEGSLIRRCNLCCSLLVLGWPVTAGNTLRNGIEAVVGNMEMLLGLNLSACLQLLCDL